MTKSTTITSLQLAALVYGHCTDDLLGMLNNYCYEGTTIRVRAASGSEVVTVTFGGRYVQIDDGMGGWLAERFGDNDGTGRVFLDGSGSKRVSAALS
jgi:hypothetical protein